MTDKIEPARYCCDLSEYEDVCFNVNTCFKEKVEMNSGKFKVGDKVRTLTEVDVAGYYRFPVGTIGSIVYISNFKHLSIKVISDDGKYYWYDEDELELVQSAEVDPVPVHNNIDISLRPCTIGERKGKFHKWIEEQKILIKFNNNLKENDVRNMKIAFELSGVIPPYADYEIITNTVALVEFDDGSVGKVKPEEVRFVV